MTPSKFLDELAGVSFPNAFNPYTDICPVFDFKQAPAVRFDMLLRVIADAYQGGTDYLWVGRDLGYRGGRRTGLALTDQTHMQAHLSRWGVDESRQIVRGEAQSERTASAIWDLLQQIEERVFLWNVFPLHPHQADSFLSNRAHTAAERDAGEGILSNLIGLLRPKGIIAIGLDAARSANRCSNVRVTAVRHPSYGGLRDFCSAIRAEYKI